MKKQLAGVALVLAAVSLGSIQGRQDHGPYA